MATHLTRIRFIVGALALAFIVAFAAPVNAQQRNPDNSVNPTASAVNESQLLNELSRISGRCTIPDQKACTIEQPAGRDWRHFHQVTLRWIGAISVLAAWSGSRRGVQGACWCVFPPSSASCTG
jgi:formate dehydrogenase subunit gamma